MNKFKFTQESLKHLRHCDDRLQHVAELVLMSGSYEFQVKAGNEKSIEVYAVFDGKASYNDLVMFEIFCDFQYYANMKGLQIIWGQHFGISNGHIELI